jgi:hypothetical protein
MTQPQHNMPNPRAETFEFLKPNHQHFKYFSALIEQYTKLLENPYTEDFYAEDDKMWSLSTQ